LKGSSTHPKIIELARSKPEFDILYIDGGHAYDVVKSDIEHYAPLVKPGGYLVIDDCNNQLDMPDGYFRGIESVSKAVDEVFPPFTQNDDWEYIGSVVHNRILRRR
jgi:cephalosporin hydroxylase